MLGYGLQTKRDALMQNEQRTRGMPIQIGRTNFCVIFGIVTLDA